MKTQKRVANYKIEALFRERVPFENYNNSITAEMVEGVYRVWHWNTHLFTLDTNSGEVTYFDFGYYSQTTSALQGKIVRALISPEEVAEKYQAFCKIGDTRNARRLRGMARMR